MGSLGVPELIIIFVVALIVFGPKKLPELGKSLGKGLAEFRRASNELKSTIEEEVRAIEAEPPPARHDPEPEPESESKSESEPNSKSRLQDPFRNKPGCTLKTSTTTSLSRRRRCPFWIIWTSFAAG